MKFSQIDNQYYKKKYKGLNKKKVLLTIIKKLIGSVSAISSCTIAKLNSSVGIIVSSSTTLLKSIAIFIHEWIRFKIQNKIY